MKTLLTVLALCLALSSFSVFAGDVGEQKLSCNGKAMASPAHGDQVDADHDESSSKKGTGARQ